MFRVGDTVEVATWQSGKELPEQIAHWKSVSEESVKAQCDPMILGPWRYTVKKPGDDRVPPVPDNVHGPDVRLLVGEADIIAERREPTMPAFIFDLREEDVEKLRVLIRRKYGQFRPGIRLTNQQCDTLIEKLGPVAVDKIVRKKVDVHHS